MANTTFSGSVRSEDNFKLVSKNTTTGLIQDRTKASGLKDTRRYYLEEYFVQLPKLNAVNIIDPDADDASALALYTLANRNFEVLGTNMTTALVDYPSAHAGMKMTTAGADQDQAILAPHLDSGQTAWTGVKWGTENSIRYETSIDITNITNVKVWAGFKLTNDQLIATDADQIFFKFQTDATNSETFADFTKLHFVHSIGGTDFISQLPITVAANTQIHLVIEVDANRQATIFVNGKQYNITSTSGTTGTAVTEVGPSQIATKTGALTNDVDFIPYVGIEAGAAEAKILNVQYLSCSRNVFE